MKDKIFLDTNVILYAISTLDSNKHIIAKSIILQDATISVQVINETSANLLKKFRFDEETMQRFLESSYNRYDIVDLSREIFIKASNLRMKYFFSYYDSIIVSAALLNGCTILYSEDMQDGLIVEEKLKIINPFAKIN